MIATATHWGFVDRQAKVGEEEIWTAWITPVFHVVSDECAKPKDLGIRLPDLPGFPPE